MSSHNVIRDVSETLRMLLKNELNQIGTSGIDVTVNAPQRVSISSGHLLNLYLYQVVEDPYAKNRGPLSRGSSVQQRAPLSLDLFYMVTPYVPSNQDALDEHIILGDAMRVLYDHPVIGDSLLQGDLRGSGANFCVVLCRLSLEEQTRIWNALQLSYRLSVCYESRISLVDSSEQWDANRVLTQETVYEQL